MAKIYVASTYICPRCGDVMDQVRQPQSIVIYVTCTMNPGCELTGQTFKTALPTIEMDEVRR